MRSCPLPVSRLGGAAVSLGVRASRLRARDPGTRASVNSSGVLSRGSEPSGTNSRGWRTRIHGCPAPWSAPPPVGWKAVGPAGMGPSPDGPGPAATADMARWAASDAAVSVAREAVQIFGGYGYMRDYPVEKLMRDASGMGICEVTGEAVRMIAARGFETAVANRMNRFRGDGVRCPGNDWRR